MPAVREVGAVCCAGKAAAGHERSRTSRQSWLAGRGCKHGSEMSITFHLGFG